MTGQATGSIAEALVTQFTSVWKMLQATINNAPAERWHDGVGQWYYSQTAYHIIETAQFYLGNDPAKMKWGARAEINWEDVNDIEKEALPKLTKELVNSYLGEVGQEAADAMRSVPDSEFFKIDGFDWFNSILDKLMYLLRHTNYHVGELNRSLREWGLKPVRWG
ncbi:MAG: hypothetical protein ACXABY_18885 [Candidatus Thorarchaeota archaeon]|jgi:uncharacterized damage-inducible protein DinB